VVGVSANVSESGVRGSVRELNEVRGEKVRAGGGERTFKIPREVPADGVSMDADGDGTTDGGNCGWGDVDAAG